MLDERKIFNLFNEPILSTYYLVFTFARIKHTKAYLSLSFLEFKTEDSRAVSLSDAPLQVLDTNSNKAVFQF